MCDTCGCGDPTGVRVTSVTGVGGVAHEHGDGVWHTHDGAVAPHRHAAGEEPHTHDAAPAEHTRPVPDPGSTLTLEIDVLALNDGLARDNRARLTADGVTAVNLMSSPGAGKTTLLERTIRHLAGGREVAVIEGDQETLLDAERIRAAGARAVQINTGAGCHLDAQMLHRALDALAPAVGSLVLVENVGNLVCPALFDLGERARAVIISVPEGDDKPLKYPHMFASADLVVVNKTDLLPYVDFDLAALTRNARVLRPGVPVIAVSARTGENLDAWYDWLAALDGGTPVGSAGSGQVEQPEGALTPGHAGGRGAREVVAGERP